MKKARQFNRFKFPVFFMVYWDGKWVKLSLLNNENKTSYKFEHTDEGWSSQGMTFERIRNVILRDVRDAGRDCDGVQHHTSRSICITADLHSRPFHIKEGNKVGSIQLPRWVDEESESYDQYAEAAGY